MINGIIQELIANVTLQGFVGQNKALDTFKVYPVDCPQGENHPYLLVRLSGRAPRNVGKNCNPVYDDLTVTLTSVSKSYSTVESIDSAAFSVLEGFSGTLSGNEFSVIRLSDSQDGYDDSADTYLRITEYTATLRR